MADPKTEVIGNRSDELAAHEEGADFSTANQSVPVGDIDQIEVEVESDGQNLLLLPQNQNPVKRHSPLDLVEGSRHRVEAQIFDDPGMMKRVAGDIRRVPQRGSLQFFAVTGHHAAAVWGDRVLIKRDSMESAYSCQSCRGKGHTEEQCPTCKGSCIDIDGGSPCRSCQVLGYGMEMKRARGHVECAFCKGAGWAGGVVRPEVTQSEPITGIVVSTGPLCVNLQLGDRVLHSRYAGHQMSAPNGEFYTIMQEHEVLELIREL